jgi:hypothetical protein
MVPMMLSVKKLVCKVRFWTNIRADIDLLLFPTGIIKKALQKSNLQHKKLKA